MARRPFPMSENHRQVPEEGESSFPMRTRTERKLRRVARAARSGELEDPEPCEAALRDAARADTEEVSLTDRDRARERVFQAWETDDPNTMKGLIEEALELDPRNADVLAWEARNLTVTPDEELAGVRCAVEAGAAALGEAYFRDHRGEFYERVETRPYLRARALLAQVLEEQGQPDEALEHLEALRERRRVMRELEEEAQQEESTDEPVPALHRTERPGRNDPCWCGSGKKYKRCHVASDEEQEADVRGG